MGDKDGQEVAAEVEQQARVLRCCGSHEEHAGRDARSSSNAVFLIDHVRRLLTHCLIIYLQHDLHRSTIHLLSYCLQFSIRPK